MKKFIAGLLIGMMVSGVGVFAADQYVATIAKFRVYVNGSDYAGEKQPLVVNNSTYLPLRDLATALGTSVEWDGKERAVYVGSRTINFTAKNGLIIGIKNHGRYEGSQFGVDFKLTNTASDPLEVKATDFFYHDQQDIFLGSGEGVTLQPNETKDVFINFGPLAEGIYRKGQLPFKFIYKDPSTFRMKYYY
jgi:hypothetical protein